MKTETFFNDPLTHAYDSKKQSHLSSLFHEVYDKKNPNFVVLCDSFWDYENDLTEQEQQDFDETNCDTYWVTVYERKSDGWEIATERGHYEFKRWMEPIRNSTTMPVVCTHCGHIHEELTQREWNRQFGDENWIGVRSGRGPIGISADPLTCTQCGSIDSLFMAGYNGESSLYLQTMEDVLLLPAIKKSSNVATTTTNDNQQTTTNSETNTMAIKNPTTVAKTVSSRAAKSLRKAAELTVADTAGDAILDAVIPFLPESLNAKNFSPNERELAKIVAALLLSTLSESGVIPESHSEVARIASDLVLTASGMKVLDPILRSVMGNLDLIRSSLSTADSE
jgi:hypothetical protein